MRAFATLTVAGLGGLLLVKLFGMLMFPILALFFGLMMLTVKIAVIAAVVFFLYSLFKRRRDDGEWSGTSSS